MALSLYKTLFLLCLTYLSACARNTTDGNNVNKLATMQNLAQNFLFKRNQKNQTISLLKDNNATLTLYKNKTKTQTKVDAGISFLEIYRKDFLINNPAKEFTVSSNKTDNLGFTRIKMSQSYHDVPVWNGVISMHFNKQNELQIVRGEYFPTPADIDINAGLSINALIKKAATLDASITQQNYTLHKIIYFKNNTTARLAYELQPIHHAKLTGHTYIFDALTGEVLNRLSNIQTLR